MKRNGANFARIWLVRWNMGLEWTKGDGNGMYQGIGRYALDNAWRIDELLRLAERNGIYLMLCLGYHGELADRQLYFGEQAWDKNPYNRKNGGPCDKPADFWTNPTPNGFTSNACATSSPVTPTARMCWHLSFGTKSMRLPIGCGRWRNSSAAPTFTVTC